MRKSTLPVLFGFAAQVLSASASRSLVPRRRLNGRATRFRLATAGWAPWSVAPSTKNVFGWGKIRIWNGKRRGSVLLFRYCRLCPRCGARRSKAMLVEAEARGAEINMMGIRVHGSHRSAAG